MKKEKPETLEMALKEMVHLIREISNLEQMIDDVWGVSLYTSSIIPGDRSDYRCYMNVRRGIEEIEKTFGKEAKRADGFSVDYKELSHYGVRFVQYADNKTKIFVKAGKEPPKVQIVEE